VARRADRASGKPPERGCGPAEREPSERGPSDRRCGPGEPPDLWALAAAVLHDGLAVVDGYASPPRVRELNLCAARRRERGEFRAARTGTPRAECAQREAAIRGDRIRGDRVRGDRICWLEEPLFPAERALLANLEGLRLMLNREGLLGAFDLEAHYAEYPSGAGYARHVDQLQGRVHRVVSLVLYLNEAWHPGAGGALRLFDAGGGAGGYRDVEPVAGRLVCFLSAGREHAVLPTREPRLSITGWFRRRD
jgi:SM-20-related protein